MLGIGSEYLELGAEELQLIEGVVDVGVGGMTFDFCVELRHSEVRIDDVALELGDVDTVRGETTERLVERRRDAAYLEYQACLLYTSDAADE